MAMFFADGNAINVKINSLFFEKFSFVNQRNKMCWGKIGQFFGPKIQAAILCKLYKGAIFMQKYVCALTSTNSFGIFYIGRSIING